jgi:hypothetical protein
MNDEEKAKLEQQAKAGLSDAGAAASGVWAKLHAWFGGHPGAAVALACGLVIGYVLGYLWPK